MYIERRMWHWVDWALFGIFTSWLGIGLMSTIIDPVFIGVEHRLWVMAWMLVSYLAALAVWHPGYANRLALPIVVFATSGLLELYLTWTNGKVVMSVLTLPLLIVGYHTVRKTAWFSIPVFLFAFPIIENGLLREHPIDLSSMLNQILAYFIVFGIGFGIQRVLQSNFRIRKLYEENLHQYQLIREQNKALEQYAAQVERQTLLEERNRLARDLHDTVGHTFTSMIMGMDAVAYLMEAAPEKAKEKMDVLRNVARNGLEEVRRSIHQIAPQTDDAALSQQLASLANEFAVHTGTQVKLAFAGEESELPKQAQLTLIRCLQESLTNAKRHGNASLVAVFLEFQVKQVLMRVEDDGIGTHHMEPGFGLTAMQERLGALQGTLHTASTPGEGTVVTCIVPLRQ